MLIEKASCQETRRNASLLRAAQKELPRLPSACVLREPQEFIDLVLQANRQAGITVSFYT